MCRLKNVPAAGMLPNYSELKSREFFGGRAAEQKRIRVNYMFYCRCALIISIQTDSRARREGSLWNLVLAHRHTMRP